MGYYGPRYIMKRKVTILPNDKDNPLDQIEDARERYRAKRKAHMAMIAKLQEDPRFDIQIFMDVIKNIERKFALIDQLQSAVSGKLGEQFSLELSEFIINYLLEKRQLSPWWYIPD
jgi:hypothetical protein